MFAESFPACLREAVIRMKARRRTEITIETHEALAQTSPAHLILATAEMGLTSGAPTPPSAARLGRRQEGPAPVRAMSFPATAAMASSLARRETSFKATTSALTSQARSKLETRLTALAFPPAVIRLAAQHTKRATLFPATFSEAS